MWKPSPPQGFTREQGQVIIGRPPIPLFGAPQGVGFAPSGNAMAYESANWADAAYKQRFPLTINGGQVPSPQNDVPLLINDIFPELAGESVESIRIGTNDFTVDYEIQKFDTSNGELIAWAKKPTVDNGDIVYVYFDGPNTVDNQNPFEVWSEYSNVYHLNNDPSTPNSILDSARAQETGNPRATTLVDAKIGKGQEFDQNAVPDPSRIQLLSWNPSTSVSISLWFKTVNSNRGVFFSTGEGGNVGIFCEFAANGTIRYVYRNPPSAGGGVDFNSPGAFDDNLFHKLVYVYDEAAVRSRIYVDGVEEANAANALGPQSAADSDGNMGTTSPFADALPYDGDLDEFQIFVGVLSDDRILTEFNNQTSQSTFYTKGAVEAVPAATIPMAYEPENWADASYLQRMSITIVAGKVPSTQNDFPLLINRAFPELMGESVESIRMGTEDFTLDYEIQKFNTVNGQLIAWVKTPSISDNDVFFIYFDGPNTVDNQNPAAVWDANYKVVSHLNGVGTDSTSNGQDFTINGTTTVPAKIGDGIDFPGGTITDFLIRNPFSGFPTTAITCEFWIKTSATGDGMVSYASASGARTNDFTVFVQESLLMFITGIQESTGVSFNDGVFHHFVVTWSSSDGELIVYIDSVSSFSSTIALGAVFLENGSLVLGQDQDTVGGGFQAGQALDGIMDELRLSDIARSADYVTTSFNNQNLPGGFYSIGMAEGVPSAIDTMEYEE